MHVGAEVAGGGAHAVLERPALGLPGALSGGGVGVLPDGVDPIHQGDLAGPGPGVVGGPVAGRGVVVGAGHVDVDGLPGQVLGPVAVVPADGDDRPGRIVGLIGLDVRESRPRERQDGGEGDRERRGSPQWVDLHASLPLEWLLRLGGAPRAPGRAGEAPPSKGRGQQTAPGGHGAPEAGYWGVAYCGCSIRRIFFAVGLLGPPFG